MASDSSSSSRLGRSSSTSGSFFNENITAQTTPQHHGPESFADGVQQEEKHAPNMASTAGYDETKHRNTMGSLENTAGDSTETASSPMDHATVAAGIMAQPVENSTHAVSTSTKPIRAEDPRVSDVYTRSKPRLLDEEDEFWGSTSHEQEKRKELMDYISFLEAKNSRLDFNYNAHLYGSSSAPGKPDAEWKYEVDRVRIVSGYAKEDIGEVEEQYMRAQATGGPILKRTREYDSHSQLIAIRLEIRSPLLVEALREAIHAEENLDNVFLHNNPVVFDAPYMLLFHHWADVQAKRNQCEGDQRAHLDFLLSWLEQECPSIARIAQDIATGPIVKIPFEALWLLYRPGTTIYGRSEGSLCAYVVAAVKGCAKLAKGSFSPLQLGLRYASAGIDVKGYFQTHSTGSIEVFATEQMIAGLDYIPAGYLPDEANERLKLIARGTRYEQLAEAPKVMEYRGNQWKKTWEEDTSRVVVDVNMASAPPRTREEPAHQPMNTFGDPYAMYPQDHYRAGPCTCAICTGFNSSDPPIWAADTFRLYLPPEIPAFSLVRKGWKIVAIDELEEPVFEEDMMSKKLVIPTEHREIVTSLVESYTSGNLRFSDFVKGKGRGLVILLHGSPGTGKTLTAECVAEEAKKPLYAITCGDLGVDSTTLEKQLRDIFDQATKWNAVLLLDEADVFLQERDIRNLERNALVSVFLRELEYFDGILFLTTNRPGQIDEAFQSRIHITLAMAALDDKSQLRIWLTFLQEEITDKRALKQCLRAVKEETSKTPLNGRQIRNCVRSALSLAAQDKTTVSIDHIRQVLALTKKFSEYMKELQGHTADERQLFLGFRGTGK